MLPPYLVTLLTYFYLRTKNFKMARAMVKSRRFVVDGDHICQQARQPDAPAGPSGGNSHTNQSSNSSPGTGTNKYVKKPATTSNLFQSVPMNYKSISKNFT